LEHGRHGLADGSRKGDWRLPNVKELQSLFDFGIANHVTLPSEHRFINVQRNACWSSTTVVECAKYAWTVSGRGLTHYSGTDASCDELGGPTKTNVELTRNVWAVRDWTVRDSNPCR